METIAKLIELVTAALHLMGAWEARRDAHSARGRHFAAKDKNGRRSR